VPFVDHEHVNGAGHDDGWNSTEDDSKAPGVLAEHWLTLGDALEWLTEEPPAQVWLLKRWHKQRDHGVFPRGRTGLLTATGGVGKTYALIQLALAVASGGFWFETFRAVEAGHVCLALAEEDVDEARRRIWRACNALALSREQRQEIASRIHVLPLAGVSVALTWSPEKGMIVASAVASELKAELEARGVDWALIIIDPLSRWASGGIEADNEAATRFCQVVETLATVRGKPAVLLAHHSSKTSAKDGASDARGVTGIRDGFRWQASMDPLEENGLHGVLLRNRKSNYSLPFDELVLVRNTEPGIEGTLRLAFDAEAAQLHSKSKKGSGEDFEERLLRALRSMGKARVKRDLVELTEGEDKKLYAALNTLLSSGRVVRDNEGWLVAAPYPAAEGVKEP
jgi:RecA-family ATPase